jgi:peptidoglycan/xylan/chitin deacetylase (PgdA/CDA1 family)
MRHAQSTERYGGAMRRAQPRPPRPRAGARAPDERRGRRAQIRRRRATLLASVGVLAACVALVVQLAGGASKARPPRTSAAATASGSAKPRGATRARGAAATASGARDGESSEIRRLIALARPIYCTGPRGDEVALTFDDGPGPYTKLVLAKLRKHGAHATFFVVGRNISLVPGATRTERAIGAVGDHTFTHPELTAIAPSEAERQIVDTQAALERSSGGPVFLFRPPYGAHDARIDSIARAHGLLEVLWTVDSGDSLGADYAQIERNVIGALRPGAIILMHENRGQTVRALLAIFAALQRKRLRAVSVPQLLTDDPPSAAQLHSAGGGCGVGRISLSRG